VSQSTLGMPAWGFLGVPVALALAAFTYGAAFIGQGLGAEEMYVLRSFVDEALRRVRDERARAAEADVPEHLVLPKTA